jgi:hypothetical protein
LRIPGLIVEFAGYIGIYIGALALGFEFEGKGGWLGVSKNTVLPFALSTAGSTVDCPKAVCPENGPDPWDWAEAAQSTRMPSTAKTERNLMELLLRTVMAFLQLARFREVGGKLTCFHPEFDARHGMLGPSAEFCVVGDFPGKQNKLANADIIVHGVSKAFWGTEQGSE